MHEPRLGRTGSVFHYIDVPDFASLPLSLSDIVLSTVPALRAGPANAFVGLVPVQPTSSREFPNTIAVRAFARLYSSSRRVAADVTIRSTITSASGRVVLDTTQSVEAERLASRGSFDVSVPVPMKDFEPGEDLLAIDAATSDEHARRAVRFLRHQVTPGAAASSRYQQQRLREKRRSGIPVELVGVAVVQPRTASPVINGRLA